MAKVTQQEFHEIVQAFMELSSTMATFPLDVIRGGFAQGAIAGTDNRHDELLREAYAALHSCQQRMFGVAAEMKARYGDSASPPGVSAGPSAIGTMRKE